MNTFRFICRDLNFENPLKAFEQFGALCRVGPLFNYKFIHFAPVISENTLIKCSHKSINNECGIIAIHTTYFLEYLTLSFNTCCQCLHKYFNIFGSFNKKWNLWLYYYFEYWSSEVKFYCCDVSWTIAMQNTINDDRELLYRAYNTEEILSRIVYGNFTHMLMQ